MRHTRIDPEAISGKYEFLSIDLKKIYLKQLQAALLFT
jgi:hypothetical protein